MTEVAPLHGPIVQLGHQVGRPPRRATAEYAEGWRSSPGGVAGGGAAASEPSCGGGSVRWFRDPDLMAFSASVDSQGPPDDVWSGWSRFVPRLSWHDTYLIEDLPADRSTTIAKSLAQAGADAQLVLQAHDEPAHKVVLEVEAWHNQRPRRARSRVFNELGDQASLRRVLNPAVLRDAADSSLVDYLTAFLSPQEARRSDAVMLPAHLAGGHGGAGRDGELRLAEVGVRLVRDGGLAQTGEACKPLLVGVAIEAEAIKGTAGAVALARSYGGLGGDGYWVQFSGLSEGTGNGAVTACATFLFALKELSARRVFAVDTKNLSWPLLAGGLAGACIGIGEREAWQGPHASSAKRRKILPTVLHRVLLRNFRADGGRAVAAFKELPCDCGAHPAGRPPRTREEIRRHTLHARLAMAAEMTGENPIAALDRWLYHAGWSAFDLGLDPPAVAAYRAVLDAAESGRAAAGS